MEQKVADPMRGALLGGRYRIMGRLAKGGMATVYQARDERLERPVAIKIIQPDHAREPDFPRRLADEAKAVARLSHPNVVAVYDQGTHDGAPYLVLEYVRGRTLRELLVDRRRLDPSESLAILEQVLAALSAAHRAGLIHRDVKPENILITPPPNGSGDLVDAVVKVADFGLAHPPEASGRDGTKLMATPEYAAPELVAEGRADARSDLYSTGIVLFEMLTGRPPFDGDRPTDVAWQHVDNEVPVPSRQVPGLPAFVDGVVARATRRDPADRPRDAAAMLAEVQSAREDVGALAGPTRALAHPTVVVGQVRPGERPSWAKLPSPRAGGVAAATRRVAELMPARPLTSVVTAARGHLDQMRNTQKGRQQLIAALIVIGILLLTGGWWLTFGRYTETPPLTALTKDNAIAEAARLGFTVEIGPGIFDENVPVDTVMTQHPAPGVRIVNGGTITLNLSRGPERYEVPDVSGQVVDYAKAKVADAKFVAQVVDGYSDTLPKDYVVGTDPVAGTPLKPGSIVKIIVARGPFPAHIPSVIGQQLSQAEAHLRSLGYTVEVVRQDNQEKPLDEVINQDPAAGQGLPSTQGVKITLTVANGPPGTPMPRVIDWGCDDARNHLQAMGLQVQVEGGELGNFAKVREQNPPENQPVQPGQPVLIRCALFG
jgi:beta-lactam-binding protein with PASTA domain/tRNA A-37 threonylcarbamoyl transferase component Bud32